MSKSFILLTYLMIICTACNNANNTSKNMQSYQTQSISSTPSGTPSVSSKNQDSTVKNEDTTVTSIFYGSYQMTDKFSELVRLNPIDKEYNKEFNEFQNSKDFSTSGWLELENKYTELWDKELNEIYIKLQALLNDKQKNILIESQKAWLKFHLKESDFVYETFIQGDPQNNLGTQGLVNLQISIKDRERERTLELMEYYYLISGKAEF